MTNQPRLTNEEIAELGEQIEAEIPELERNLAAVRAAVQGASISASVGRAMGRSTVPLSSIAVAAKLTDHELSQLLQGQSEVTNPQRDSMVQA